MTAQNAPALITPQELLEHWQSHRRLTRKTLEAFPEDKLFTFQPAPPMRSFGAMLLEITGMVYPTLKGFKTGEWSTIMKHFGELDTKAALLEAMDETDAYLNATLPTISAERMLERESVYGFPVQPLFHALLYLIDNEIHHRAQGYVYLRLLGIEPPSFYQR